MSDEAKEEAGTLEAGFPTLAHQLKAMGLSGPTRANLTDCAVQDMIAMLAAMGQGLWHIEPFVPPGFDSPESW